MYIINFMPTPYALQPFSNLDEFFQAVERVDLIPLEQALSKSLAAASLERRKAEPGDSAPDGEIPQTQNQRGRKLTPAWPFLLLRMWSLFQGSKGPRTVRGLETQMRKHNHKLARKFGFARTPDRQTIKERFQILDRHRDLLIEALRDGSPQPRQLSLFSLLEGPLLEQKQPEKGGSSRSTGVDAIKEALGDDEFEEMVPRGTGADNFIFRHLHGGVMICTNCRPGECNKLHEHGVKERPPREERCPDPARHDDECIHEMRLVWRCKCCGHNLSTTSEVEGLKGRKVPPRVLLRCMLRMVTARYGMSVHQMSRHLNRRRRTSRPSTVHRMMHLIRELGMRERHPIPFAGPVEIDDAKVKLKDGVVFLLGAYDHATRRVYIEIKDRQVDQPMMRDFVTRVSLPGSRVYTDGTAAWPPGMDRIHGVVIHCDFEFSRREEPSKEFPKGYYITTNRIEGSWGLIRRALRIPRTITRRYFPLFLDEEMWRTNHLRNRLEAASYKGEERRGASLMKQLVANMGRGKLSAEELQDGGLMDSDREAAGPPSCHGPVTPDQEQPDQGDWPLAA